jgi:predicted nucleic acid-binding protein
LEHAGKLAFVNPVDVPAETYLDLLLTHELGEGETECIALALTHSYVFCCDDAKARSVATDLIGIDRVVGSLRLLKWTVESGLTSSEEAFSFYQSMKAAGGFLPDIGIEWFRS